MLKGRMKTELLKARATKIEKQAFQEAAELAGLPLSAWVRERLRRAARIELEDAGRRIPFVQASLQEEHDMLR
jgi:uncharacterized protein (DUF1778 family)